MLRKLHGEMTDMCVGIVFDDASDFVVVILCPCIRKVIELDVLSFFLFCFREGRSKNFSHSFELTLESQDGLTNSILGVGTQTR